MTLGKRVAVFLVYSPTGLLPSHHIALNYLIRCGYTPVVVSNLPLGADDLTRLRPITAAVILRPNFGYDFGGYREAILYLAPSLPALDHLALFNDSCWFPAQPTHNWLDEAERKRLDFVGSVFHIAFPARRKVDGTTVTWHDALNAPHFHYGAFSLLIGKRPLSDPEFLSFWQQYRMSGSKDATVRRGEHGLTGWMIRHGYSHGATCDTTHLGDILLDLPSPRLVQIAAALISDRFRNLQAQIQQATTATPADRASLIALILTVVAVQGPAYALVEYDVKDRTGTFIKKAPVTWSPFTAAQTMSLLESLPTEEARLFLAEARSLSAQARRG